MLNLCVVGVIGGWNIEVLVWVFFVVGLVFDVEWWIGYYVVYLYVWVLVVGEGIILLGVEFFVVDVVDGEVYFCYLLGFFNVFLVID